jgi:tRNA (guanine-N7-)-methyltransferase
VTQPPVRTFHARHGRHSALAAARLAGLGPRYAVPPGFFVPEGASGRRPVVVEIGCGYGDAALAYALAHPEHDLVAVDVHPPGLARLLAAVHEAGLTNLHVQLADAVEMLSDWVPAGAVDAVHLFFPDPWPKNRHRRRRFVSRHTLDLLASRLTEAGHILLATDWDDYAGHVQAQVRQQGAFVARGVARPSWRPVAGYEAKALAAGREVTDLRLDRTRSGAS